MESNLEMKERQTDNKKHCVYFLEKLTSGLWLFELFPSLLKNRQHAKITVVYYLYSSRLGLMVAGLVSKPFNIKLERFNFNISEIFDKNGESIWWKALFEDSVTVQEFFKNHPEFQKIIRKYRNETKLLLYLTHRLLVFDNTHVALIRILLFLRAASIKHGLQSQESVNIFLRSSRRPWLNELGKWALKENIVIIPIRERFHFRLKDVLLRVQPLKHFLKKAIYQAKAVKFKIKEGILFKEKKLGDVADRRARTIHSGSKDSDPKIAVEFYGDLNLFSPHLHSNLFFCQQSKIPHEEVVIYFQHFAFPLTEKKWQEIKKGGMSAVVINPMATTIPDAPLFHYRSSTKSMKCVRASTDQEENFQIRKDLYKQVTNYQQQRDYWTEFFSRHNVKIHISWYRYEAKYFPLVDALQNAGGVSVIYQRSFDHISNPWFSTVIDVFFGFSRQAFEAARNPLSIIPYYIITGYLSDYRFSLVRNDAQKLRSRLQSHGAEKIVAYFDENSSDDPRWHIGDKATQENYSYLLNKVLENPTIGLVIKPKMAGTLQKRLEGVSLLLRQAQNTGRCLLLDEGDLLGAHSPAIAALAADVAIHGHLSGGTAGMEAALTGTPTLLLDREKWFKSPLYKLEVNRVIFHNWDDLWEACLDHWQIPGGMPGFGDWSSMIDELDPFRDGRAAERMGDYLKWLNEGFKAGLSRETVLADAAERYAKIWGQDNVLSVNCRPITEGLINVA